MKKLILKPANYFISLLFLLLAPVIANTQASIWFWQEPSVPEALKTSGE